MKRTTDANLLESEKLTLIRKVILIRKPVIQSWKVAKHDKVL